MKKWVFRLFFSLSIFLIVSLFVHAQEKEEKKEKSWKYFSSTSLSLVMVKGNNENFSYCLDTEHNLHIKKNRFNFKGRFINAKSNGKKTSEIYYSHLKYDHELKSRTYLLGFVRYERNKLAGYNFRIALSGGGGATWIKRPKVEFSSELAFGWNNENNIKRVNLKNVTNSSSLWQKTISSSFVSSIVTNKFLYKINKTAQLIHQETIFFNTEDIKDYRLNSYSSISTNISPKLALKTSIQIIYEKKPVEGYKNTDFFLLTSLVIKI